MRRSGVFLPVSSLPTFYGIGDLGESARTFGKRLSEAGQSLWQILPLTVPDFVHSPYASLSAFAGSPLLIDPEGLFEDAFLTREEIDEWRGPVAVRTDYPRAERVKETLLRKAFARFDPEREDFLAFCRRSEEWLPDYALFDALHTSFGGRPLWEWPEEIQRREPDALSRARETLSGEIAYRRFQQFVFDKQLTSLRSYLSGEGVALLGDLPFYVAGDSADVWTFPELFDTGAVAGVPPDFFTAEGQLWGNPLYDFGKMQEDGFDWWIRRLTRAGEMYDEVRLDHFRALHSYYAIPKGARDARSGQWREGPGMAFFSAIRAHLPSLSLIAEDLGDIPPAVLELREEAGVPGMRILDFAFDGNPGNPFLPHNYSKDTVVYLGTHDNDTTAGWWTAADENTRKNAAAYLGISPHAGTGEAVDALLRAAAASVADTVVFTMQDIRREGSEYRVNTPGQTGGCWEYALPRLPAAEDFAFLSHLTALYGRTKSH